MRAVAGGAIAGDARTAPAVSAPAGLGEALLGWRDRLIASPRFQRWAASFPLTRPIARRQSRVLFDLVAGFVYAQVLAAAIELDLLNVLAERPRGLGELAARLELGEAGTLTLLRACASLGLVTSRAGGRWGLGLRGAALVGNPAVGAMIAHHAMLYADLADPVALLRGRREQTRLARYWPYAGAADPTRLGAGQVAGYSGLMAASQAMIAAEVVAAHDFRRHRVLMDVGGGEGGFVCAVAGRAPSVRVRLLDLPAVAERARQRFAAAGLGARAEAIGADFVAPDSAWPGGADVITLVRVVHDHDDAVAMRILHRARAALPPGGTLLLAEPMAGTPGAEPAGDAYFGFYLLAMGSGRPRRAEELAAMLRAAGFASVREERVGNRLLVRVLCARVAAG